MTPNIDTGAPPPFHQLHPNTFELMSRDLLSKQEHIALADLYGTRGQTQYGVDILAKYKDEYANVAAQCKCYSTTTTPDLRLASDEFLNHLARWKNFNIKKFILIVACALDRTELQDEIQAQIKRFHEHGIQYEAWSASTLRTKLAPHADVVRAHIRNQYWVEQICGSSSGAFTKSRGLTSGVEQAMGLIGSEFETITSIVSREIGEKIESIRELNRQGRTSEALDRVNQLRQDQSWDYLDKPLQAKILRVAAALTLSKIADTQEAQRLADGAAVNDPQADETFIRTLLRYYKQGAADALLAIPQPFDLDTLNLKAAILVELGQVDEVILLIDNTPTSVKPDAETWRLKALALLGKREHNGARAEVEKALAERPNWEGVQIVAAIVDYYVGISPAAYPRNILIAPEPVEWSYIKRDTESLKCFRRAEEYFAALALDGEKPSDKRDVFSIWHLACLANDPDRQDEAVVYCRTLLESDPTNPYALTWAISRNFEVDFAKSQRALERRTKREPVNLEGSSLDTLLVLIGIYIKGGKLKNARKLLEQKKPALTSTEARSLWSFWYAQVLAHEKDFKKALLIARREANTQFRSSIKTMVLRMQYVVTGQWKPYARYLEKCLGGKNDGELLLELCRLHAEREHWAFVADRAEQLIEALGTADAVRLASGALWKTHRTRKCLEILESHNNDFPDSMLPADLSRLRAGCKSRLGALSGAVTEAELSGEIHRRKT